MINKLIKKNKYIITLIMCNLFIFNVSAEKYNNIDTSSVKSCGNGLVTGIPSLIPKVVSISITLIQIAVPVVLIIFGMLDMFKAISSQKEDDIKKGQKMLIKRLISAALIFFVFVIVKFVISLVADNSNIISCAECFIKNKCS